MESLCSGVIAPKNMTEDIVQGMREKIRQAIAEELTISADQINEPFRLLDGCVGLLIRLPGEDGMRGIQIPGEQDIRCVHPSELTQASASSVLLAAIDAESKAHIAEREAEEEGEKVRMFNEAIERARLNSIYLTTQELLDSVEYELVPDTTTSSILGHRREFIVGWRVRQINYPSTSSAPGITDVMRLASDVHSKVSTQNIIRYKGLSAPVCGQMQIKSSRVDVFDTRRVAVLDTFFVPSVSTDEAFALLGIELPSPYQA